MAEPSRSGRSARRRTCSSENHWFDASLIPKSHTMGFETGNNFHTASRDNEMYDLGRQFSKIAVDAFRLDADKVERIRAVDQCSSAFQDMVATRPSESEEARQTTVTRAHHHSQPRQYRHWQYQTQVNQNVPSLQHAEMVRSTPRAGSTSSSRSALTNRSHPLTPSNSKNTSNLTFTTFLEGTKQMTKLHNAPSQPVLMHASSCGSDESAEQNLPQDTQSPKRPFSIHLTSKVDQHHRRYLHHQMPSSPDSSLSEKVDHSVPSGCKMRLAPSCPSQLGPTMLGLVNANSPERTTATKITLATTTTTTSTAATNATTIATNCPANIVATPVNTTKSCQKSISKDRVCAAPLRSGTFGLYNIQETIGVGNFSQVKLATHVLTKELVAIKVLDKTRMDAPTRRLLLREISILEMLHHPNIVRLYEVMETLTRLHLVMEYVAGGDLNKRINTHGKFTENEAKIIFAQLIAAVNHLHERNIFHRDIKADNILFTQRTPTHSQSCTNSGNMPSSSPTAHTNRTSGVKSNGYRRHIRKWFHNKSRDAVSVYPRSRSETRPDSSTRRSVTPSETRLTRAKPSKTRLNRSRWDSSHANADLGAYGDRCNTQDISLCPEYYRVKLADFGFSKLTLTQNQPLTTFCGSPAYAAPELFQAQNYQGGPVDMWALGIVLFFLLTGLLPYRGSTVGHVRRLVLENRGLQPPEWLSDGARTLYLKLTARQPSDRPSSRTLLRCENSDQQCKPTRTDDKTNASQISSRDETVDLQPWLTWLSGQIFPKALPRFSKCPPLVCSLRRKNTKKSEEVEPEVSDTAKTIIDIKSSNTNTTNAATTVTTNPSTCSIPEEEQKTAKQSVRSDLEHCRQKQLSKEVHSPQSASSLSTDEQKSIQTNSIQSSQSLAGDAEMEAARMLLELGVTREEIAASDNQDSRSAVTGAYRIMLHRAHRARRLSHLDPTKPASPINRSGIPNSVSTPQMHPDPQSSTEQKNKRHRTLSPRRTAAYHGKKTSRFCVIL